MAVVSSRLPHAKRPPPGGLRSSEVTAEVKY